MMKKLPEWESHVSRETILKLEQYDALLHKWQKAINLISSKTLGDSWNRHFVDSMQILPLIDEKCSKALDLGCGAGFSGVVTAICKPEIEMHLAESDTKKCNFMAAVSRETKIPVKVHNIRIEKLGGDSYDLITARALCSLVMLFDYSYRFVEVNPELIFVFHKGERFQQEIDDARRKYSFDVDIYQSITDDRGCVLKVSALKKLD